MAGAAMGWRDLALYGIVALGAISLTAAFATDPALPFARFFGDAPPVPVVTISAALGAVALTHLVRAGWAGGAWSWRLAAAIAGLASAFAAVTVVSDLLAPFPADMNAALPGALAFYPIMGFVVEALFHLLPLAVLLALLAVMRPAAARPVLFWAAAIPVVLSEPVFQVLLGGATSPGWQNALVALHLTAFGLVQMWLLRRAGFAAAFAFRMVYYLIWHAVWGWARLLLLFPAG